MNIMNIKKILMLLGLAGLLNAGLTRAQAPETVRPQDSLIAVDTVLKDGIRFIQSRDFEIYRGWTTGAAFNLSYADRPGDTTPYRLNITFIEGQLTMTAGETKLLLKLKKAKTVLELINTKNIGPSDYWSELTKDGTYYYTTPSFAISEAQIQQIAADKVAKMRLIYDKGKFDREIQNNAAVLGFRAAYAAIRQRLEAATAAGIAEEPVTAVEAKPEEEASYGYIVDEEGEGNSVEEEEAVEEVEETTEDEKAEAVEEAVAEETEETEEKSVEEVVEEAEEATEEQAEAVEEEAVEEAVTTPEGTTPATPVEVPESVAEEAAEAVEETATMEENAATEETTAAEETVEPETETEADPATDSEETVIEN